MPFNSLYFVVFLLAALVVHHGVLHGWQARKRFLLAASWIFYATWSPRFLVLLLAVTWVDFQLARALWAARGAAPGALPPARRPYARRLLAASVALNLGVLGLCKYGAFFYGWFAAPAAPLLAFVAPLGISFYVLHAISYLVDTYRGVRPPSERLGDFALYLAFFPQLVAGPITRWNFFGPQLTTPRALDAGMVHTALALLAAGFAKKVVCADSLGAFVDQVYVDPAHAGQVEAWLAVYAYAFQIYFDFSGYTDIAWGTALLFGFRLPENFRHPYLAESPREFWQRWHISLSTWLRDYIYLPLLAATGRQTSALAAAACLIVTMTLGGLWHGAAWTFVAWGAVHGVWLAAHRLLVAWRPRPRSPAWVRRVLAFHTVALALVLFRAGSLATAAAVVRALGAGRPLLGPLPVGALALVLFGVATHVIALRVDLLARWRRVPLVLQGAGYAAVMVAVGLLSAQTGRFIYFVF